MGKISYTYSATKEMVNQMSGYLTMFSLFSTLAVFSLLN